MQVLLASLGLPVDGSHLVQVGLCFSFARLMQECKTKTKGASPTSGFHYKYLEKLMKLS